MVSYDFGLPATKELEKCLFLASCSLSCMEFRQQKGSVEKKQKEKNHGVGVWDFVFYVCRGLRNPPVGTIAAVIAVRQQVRFHFMTS